MRIDGFYSKNKWIESAAKKNESVNIVCETKERVVQCVVRDNKIKKSSNSIEFYDIWIQIW